MECVSVDLIILSQLVFNWHIYSNSSKPNENIFVNHKHVYFLYFLPKCKLVHNLSDSISSDVKKCLKGGNWLQILQTIKSRCPDVS